MMYRNSYLQLYKSSASQEQDPTVLLTHFSQIYNTLGCVLQDLEYHIGRLQLQHSKLLLPDPPTDNHRPNPTKPTRNTRNEREIVKIEDSPDHPPNKKPRASDKDAREPANNTRKMVFAEDPVKYENVEPRVEVGRTARNSEKAVREGEPDRRPLPQSVEKVRAAAGRQSDSFDELFGGVQEQRTDHPPPKLPQQHLAPIPQNPSENENSQPPNTYDDFMDRILNRRSK